MLEEAVDAVHMIHPAGHIEEAPHFQPFTPLLHHLADQQLLLQRLVALLQADGFGELSQAFQHRVFLMDHIEEQEQIFTAPLVSKGGAEKIVGSRVLHLSAQIPRAVG